MDIRLDYAIWWERHESWNATQTAEQRQYSSPETLQLHSNRRSTKVVYIYIYINPPYPTLDFVLGLVPENSEVPQEAVALETEGGT